MDWVFVVVFFGFFCLTLHLSCLLHVLALHNEKILLIALYLLLLFQASPGSIYTTSLPTVLLLLMQVLGY